MAIDYLHPLLEPVLKPTYGVILYQEQVMQIAQVLAGYSLGVPTCCVAPWARRSPRRWPSSAPISSRAPPARHRRRTSRAHIFDLMEKFAGYGFNKSHSAAYALIAYQTAWLKAHYPEAFMAAVLSADMDNTDKLVVFKDDCVKTLGITLEPPT
jgi:DNA polymerase III subunit alpha